MTKNFFILNFMLNFKILYNFYLILWNNYTSFNMIFYILFFNIIMNMNHFSFSNPMNLNFFLIITSIIFCLISSKIQKINILPCMMFLIMIGGLLILFLYFTSICPNESFTLKFNYIYIYFNILIFSILMINFINLNWNNSILNKSMWKMNYKFNNIEQIYIYPFNFNTLLMLIILILILFFIIKSININKNSKTMKSFNY